LKWERKELEKVDMRRLDKWMDGGGGRREVMWTYLS